VGPKNETVCYGVFSINRRYELCRKKFSKELNAQIELDAIKCQKSIAELASEHGEHANKNSIWKKQLLDGFKMV